MPKPSPVRDRIRDLLLNGSRHLWSLDELLERVRTDTGAGDYSTVFRAVAFLEEKGLVQKVELGDGRSRYEPADDHHDHVRCTECGRRVTVLSLLLGGIQASPLGLLTLSGTILVWQILLVGFLYGVVIAFETPARQSLISQMVNSRADLPNAIALNSVLMNGGRLIGPSIAGLLLVFIS